jgi:hypothetical protein
MNNTDFGAQSLPVSAYWLPSSTSGLHPQQSNVLAATEGYHDCHCQHVYEQNSQINGEIYMAE